MVDTANSTFYSANVSSLTTDFNVTPYYDDFDSSKNYYRILFKPGFAVQARELTQIQSILQDQIQTFGQHLFKEGSQVLGGKFNINTSVPYVKVRDQDSFGSEVSIAKYTDQIVTGQTTGIKAYVNLVADGLETSQNTKTLYVTYMSGNPDTNAVVFADGETLASNVGTLVVKTSAATGTGSVFTINEGVRFAKEHFIHHDKQSIPIDRYGNSPTCQVGFIVSEDIINASQDSSLLDPALESSNFAAPGADRFKLTPELSRFEVDDVVTPTDFVQLLTIRNGVVEELNERPAYNVIRDEIAKRTADESGDYYVRGFDTIIQEHLDLSDVGTINDGYLTSTNGGDTNLLSLQVGQGTAYVKGYEVNKLTTSYLTIPKANAYTNINSQIVSSSLGTYALVNESVGAWPLDFGYSVDLYNTAQQRITKGTFSSAQPSGSKIGTARIKSLSYETGTLGTPTANLRLHLADIQMIGTNTYTDVRNIHYYNSTSGVNAAADIVTTTSNTAIIYNPTTPLLYQVGMPYVKTIRSSDDTVDTTFTYKKTTDVVIQTDGTFTISATAPEIFGYGTAALSNADKKEFFLTFTDASFNVAMAGTTASASGATLTGNPTVDFTKLSVGNAIEFSQNTGTYIITAINSSTSLTVNKNLPANMSGNTIYKAYKQGSMIDLTGVGRTGTAISVQGDSTQLTIDLKETFSATKTATITSPVNRTSAKEIAKTLRPNRFVKIYLGASPYNTNLAGPFNLGISDVYKIRSIRRKGSDFTAAGQGTDVTSQFTFDNGQRDDFYGFATISPTKVTSALTTADYLLVELDYFAPDFTLGAGYFSVDSYPINDTNPSSLQITTAQIPVYVSPITGNVYDLRNYLDFRPVYHNTADDITSGSVSGMSANPASASSFTSEASGLRLPADSEPVTFDYQYYLARLDMLAVDKDGNFNVIQGVSARTPRTPSVPDNLMPLAQINITPYPSISLAYAKVLNRTELACIIRKIANVRYTMRDIGVIKNRVDNIEKYISLSLLEKDALDLKVLDADGLDRFKNGIFVDSFANHSLGDYTNIDYKICVDPKEYSIRPLQEMQSLGYELTSNTNCRRIGNLVLLNYTEETLIDQPKATTYRNVETTVYRFIGKIYLEPETDFWMNTKRLTNQVIEVGDKQEITPLTVTEGNWELVTGSFKVGKNIDKNVLADPELNFYNLAGKNNNAQKNKDNIPSTLASDNNFNTFNIAKQTWVSAQEPNKFKVGKDDVYVEYQQKITTTTETASTSTQNLGDRVIDVSMIPDIRPQTIAFNGTGLKANTKHYVYFDGVDMSAYVTPSTVDPVLLPYGLQPVSDGDTTWPPVDRKFAFKASGAKGSALYSNNDGNVFGLLTLPDDGSKTFRVGTKEVIITDSPTNEGDATSAAKASFVAQGMSEQKQGTILSTRTVTKSPPKEQIKIEKLFFNDPSCMAYSFIPKAPEGEEGVFLTSVDVFFAAKDPNLGIWFEVREMDNASGITRTQVPFSEVWLKSSQVNVSDNGQTATTITFPSPVFLLNNVEYAFVIHTEGINPNYYMWVSVLGENDVVTKKPVTSRGLTGSLYTTNNNLDWDIVPRVDLKIKFKRAKFATGSVGEVILGNEPKEFLSANTVSTAFTDAGELFYGNDRIFLSSTTYTPNVNDYIIGSTTTVNTSVLAISSGTYFMSNTGYKVGETVTIRSSTGTILGTGTVASKNTASGFLYSYVQKRTNTDIVFTSSSGKFYAGDVIRGNVSGQSAVVQSLDKFVYALSQFEPGYINFKKTGMTFQMQTANNNGTYGNYDPVNPGIRNYYSEEKVIQSRSVVGKPSNNVRVTLSSTSDYLSPILDLGRTHTVYANNVVNSNTSGETAASGGGLKNKYISQIVTLAQGQDAEDAIVIITAYRPPTSNSNVKVYMKISHSEDPDPISSRNWIEMDYLDDTYYSSLANRTDFREYTFKFPDSYLVGTIGDQANVVQYTTSAGATYVGFKQFQVKIGLQSDNAAVVPRVADLRVIALQK